MMKKNQGKRNNFAYASAMALGLLFSSISKAKSDPVFIKAKNNFVEAVKAGDWDKAGSAFTLIEDDLGKALPQLSSLLQNKLREAIADNDFDAAKALVEWVAKLPAGTSMNALNSALSNAAIDAVRENDFDGAEMSVKVIALLPQKMPMNALHSALSNKVVEDLKKNNFDEVGMSAKVIALLPEKMPMNAVMSAWSNKLVDALRSGNYKEAQDLAKAFSVVLDEGTNINAVASILRRKLVSALENNDHSAATMLSVVASHLPANANMMSVLSTLKNRMFKAMRQEDIEQAIDEVNKEVLVASFLPKNARQHFFERGLLPELARQIKDAFNNNNFQGAQKWGAWLDEVREYATSEEGKNAIKRAEKFLDMTERKQVKDGQ